MRKCLLALAALAAFAPLAWGAGEPRGMATYPNVTSIPADAELVVEVPGVGTRNVTRSFMDSLYALPNRASVVRVGESAGGAPTWNGGPWPGGPLAEIDGGGAGAASTDFIDGGGA